MSKRAVWAVASAAAAVVVFGLICVARFRYASPLVEPAPPSPDYALQAAIAYVGIAAVLIVAPSFAALISRRPAPRVASTLGASAVILALGIATAIVAFVASAR